MVKFSKEEAARRDARTAAARQYYEPDTVTDTPPSLHKPTQANKYAKDPDRKMHIPRAHYEQAGRIAERYPKMYSKKGRPCWQAVIRAALESGMPRLERPEEQLTAIKQGLEPMPVNKAGGGGFRTHCPAPGGKQNTKCIEYKCRECHDAGRPLYEPEK